MKIKGKAWCPNCQQEQPASLLGLSINGEEKTVTGTCSVCEHPVSRTFTLASSKKETPVSTDENNCVPLHPQKEKTTPVYKAAPSTQNSAEIERPSIFTLVALFSVCLVITYLL